MRVTSRGGIPQTNGAVAVPAGGMIVEYDLSNPTATRLANGTVVVYPVNPWSAWSARSAWPNHPAVLPPLPRATKSDALTEAPFGENASNIRHTYRAEQSYQSYQPYQHQQRNQQAHQPLSMDERSRPLPRRNTVNTAREAHRRDARNERTLTARTTRSSNQPTTRTTYKPRGTVRFENLAWPESFDDWMMDIVRRRALRLNSGARRRGVQGTVRAVDLAHILDRTADAQGRWHCAICQRVVTLDELSFDHVMALADGGEHAAYNLVPAHRKCNEIKGSEKAQQRADALDRWLTEWATPDRQTTRQDTLRRGRQTRHSSYVARPAEPMQRYA